MRFTRFFSVAAAVFTFLLCSDSFGDNRFFLVDQRTQIPIMCCQMPSGWLAGGRCDWIQNNPAVPAHWHVWTMRPDGRAKIIISSQQILASPGALQHSRILQDTAFLANEMRPILQKDYHLSEIVPVGAEFIRHEQPQELLKTRLRQAQERGVRITNLFFTELVVRYEGICNGEKRVVVMSLPMLAAESQASALSRSSSIELLQPMSFCCPPEDEAGVKATLQAILPSVKYNPEFVKITNYISQMRTESWIRTQNEIRDKQFEVARSTSETQDKVRNMWSEYIRDVDSVSNPNTGEKMFVDNRYNHAWINSNNEIIYQDSSLFNPNQDRNFNHTEWKQLK